MEGNCSVFGTEDGGDEGMDGGDGGDVGEGDEACLKTNGNYTESDQEVRNKTDKICMFSLFSPPK